MNWKVAGMAGTAFLTVALTGVGAVAGANKFTGNISLAAGQTWVDLDPAPVWADDSFASLTGTGNLNVAFSNNINLQLGMQGDAAFFDDAVDRKTGFGVNAHVYTRNDKYALGVFGGVGANAREDNDSADHYFVGVEGQYYWSNFTFGLNGGYLDSDSANGASDQYLSDAWFVGGEVRWYANPKTTVSASLGYISGEVDSGTADADTLHWGAKVEYRPEEKEPLSLFVAYEGRSSELDWGAGPNYEKDTHTIKIGVTFHFGVDGDNVQQDRTGPAFNNMDYGAIVVGG